jgi:hypothetical protein
MSENFGNNSFKKKNVSNRDVDVNQRNYINNQIQNPSNGQNFNRMNSKQVNNSLANKQNLNQSNLNTQRNINQSNFNNSQNQMRNNVNQQSNFNTQRNNNSQMRGYPQNRTQNNNNNISQNQFNNQNNPNTQRNNNSQMSGYPQNRTQNNNNINQNQSQYQNYNLNANLNSKKVFNDNHEKPKNHRMFLNRRVKHWIEDFFILLVILLNVLDFFKVLSEDLDFFKKIISWLCLGYLMYHVNIAKIIFGKESHEDFHGKHLGLKIKDIDFLIILSFFLLLFKNMTYFASENYLNAVYSRKILEFLAVNINTIDLVTMQIGGAFLLIISIVLAFKYDIRAPSIMAIIHEEGDPSTSKIKLFIRFLTIYLVLNFFFIILFNFFMEWMAFAVDAPLIVVGILFYLIIIFRTKSKFNTESLLFKIGNFGEGFYEKFLELFYTKKGLYLGVTGLLILHLLTDISNFILPYTTGSFDSLYFSNLYDKIHMPLFDFDFSQFPPLAQTSLFMQNLAYDISFFSKIIMFFSYIFSIIGALFLMVAPAFIWYNVYISDFFSVKRIIIAFFLISVIILLFNGIFDIDKIHNHPEQKESPLVGVDIQTQKIEKIIQMNVVFFVSILIGILGYILSKRQIIKNLLIRMCSVVVIFIFGAYVYFFSSDYISAQLNSILFSLEQNQFFISLILSIFLLAILLFYIGSFILFLIESYYELKNLKE